MDFSQTAEIIRAHPKLVGAEDFEYCGQRIVCEKQEFHNGESVGKGHGSFEWVSLRVLQRRQLGEAVGIVSEESDILELVGRAILSAQQTSPDPWFCFPLWRQEGDQGVAEDFVPWQSSLPGRLPESILLEEEVESREVITFLFRKTERHARESHRKLSLGSIRLSQCDHPDLNLKCTRRASRQGGFPAAFELDPNFVPVFEELTRSPRLECRPPGPVLMNSHAASEFLRAAGPLFCADNTGCLLTDETPPFFSPLINISDVGEHPNGILTGPFDLEGVNSQKTTLVSGGKRVGRLCDSYRASQLTRLSTGNRRRDASELWPRIQPSTLIMQCGTALPAELLHSMKRGCFLHNIFSVAHTAPNRVKITGMGWRVDAPGILVPFSSLTFEFDILMALQRVVGVGSDLGFYGGVGSPSILFEEMPLKGNE